LFSLKRACRTFSEIELNSLIVSETPLEATMDADQNNPGHPSNFLVSESRISKTSTETTKPGDKVHSGEFGIKSSASSIIAALQQTEYKSYAEYLGQVKQTRPQFEDLWQCLYGKHDGASFGAFRILIADSGKDGIKGNMWASDSSTGKKMSKKVVSRITTPPNENVQIRIIVLELALRRQTLTRDIVDAIGLTYDVNPAFLNAFFCHSRDKINVSSRHSARSPLPQDNLFLRFHGFCIGQVMDRPHPSGTPMKLGKLKLSRKLIQDTILSSVVLVLSWMPDALDPYVHGIALDGAPSIYVPLREPLSCRSSFHFENEMNNAGSHCQRYGSWLFQLDQHQHNFNNSHPYEFIYPWVEYRMHDVEADICRLRLKLDKIRANFSRFGELGDPDERFNDEDLFSHANNVRDSLADALEVRRTLAKLGDAENKRKAEDVRDYIRETVEDADRGLRIISEMQQTAIGTMAIQESRRSIKEAMAVKRLTQVSIIQN
jgi:hypothetical protein